MRPWILAGLLTLGGACDDAPSGPPRSVRMDAGLDPQPEAQPVVEPEAEPPVAQRDFLTSFNADLVTPTYAAMRSATIELKAAADAWATAPTDGAAKDAARAAWQAAMDVWQRAEVLQIGPASVGRPGSERIRDEIYSWPQENPCRIDQELAQGGFAADGFAAAHFVYSYGLDALEYVLHAPPGNACPAAAPPNSNGAWEALGADGVEGRRAEYAAIVAGQLVLDVARLSDAWAPFGADLARAGDGSTHYDSRLAAYNDIFVALFYLDLVAKDAKIGDVAGITAGCAAEICPENAESPWAGREGANLAQNLLAAEGILFGAPGVDGATGFSQLLEARGATALVTDLRAALDDAKAAVAALDAPFRQLVIDHPGDLQAAYDAIQRLIDLLRTQFATTLNLNVPAEGPSDND